MHPRPQTDNPACPQASTVSHPPTARRQHRLGPLISWDPLSRPLLGRLYAAMIVAGAGGILAVAATLTPSPDKVGTHRELGLPPCGFLSITQMPCPTCGMTTAFAHTIRGELIAALTVQAAGFVLAIATAVAAVIGLGTVFTGRVPVPNWYRIPPMQCVWAGLVLFVAAWAVKVLTTIAAQGRPGP